MDQARGPRRRKEKSTEQALTIGHLYKVKSTNDIKKNSPYAREMTGVTGAKNPAHNAHPEDNEKDKPRASTMEDRSGQPYNKKEMALRESGGGGTRGREPPVDHQKFIGGVSVPARVVSG